MAIYRVVPKMTLLGQEVRNVFAYASDADLSEIGKQEMVDQHSAEMFANLGSVLVGVLTSYAYDVQRIDLPGQPVLQYIAANQPWSGTNVTGPVATQTAGLLSASAPTSRPNRARTYIAGLNKGDIVSGVWNAAVLGALEGFGEDTLTLENIEGQDVDRVVVRMGGDPPVVILSSQLVSCVARSVPATQRRRRIGVGL